MNDQRSPKDYAIEHGEYLAKAAVDYMTAQTALNRLEDDEDTTPEVAYRAMEALTDHWRNLESCVYEFRKRAARAADMTGDAP
jgi:hypothetical protein